MARLIIEEVDVGSFRRGPWAGYRVTARAVRIAPHPHLVNGAYEVEVIGVEGMRGAPDKRTVLSYPSRAAALAALRDIVSIMRNGII